MGKIGRPAVLNLIGKRFGKYVAIAEARAKGGQRAYLCRCDCGNERVVIAGALNGGHQKSCGCLQRIPDLSGQIYGQTTILEYIPGRFRKKRYRCRCACGNEFTRALYDIRQNPEQGCGCMKGKNPKPSLRKGLGVAAMNGRIASYRHGAARRGLAMTLTHAEITALFQGDCFYCGAGPANVAKGGRTYGSFTYSGIDRVDNELGYVTGNVVSCCKTCNERKRASTQSDFIDWACRIADKHRQRLDG